MTKPVFTLDEIHEAEDYIKQLEADPLASVAKPVFTLDEIHEAEDYIKQLEADRSARAKEGAHQTTKLKGYGVKNSRGKTA